MGYVRAGSHIRQVMPVYLIVNASSAGTARARLRDRGEANGFTNVSVTDSGGWLNSEITFEAWTRGDFGDEAHIRQLIDGMAMAEGFRPVAGQSRLQVLHYASPPGQQQQPQPVTPYSPPGGGGFNNLFPPNPAPQGLGAGALLAAAALILVLVLRR